MCACMSVCACASLLYAKYLWHVYQRVQNVKMVSVSVCVHVSVCIFVCCGVPNIKLVKCKMVSVCVCLYLCICVYGMPFTNLVSLACLPMSQKVQNVKFF